MITEGHKVDKSVLYTHTHIHTSHWLSAIFKQWFLSVVSARTVSILHLFKCVNAAEFFFHISRGCSWTLAWMSPISSAVHTPHRMDSVVPTEQTYRLWMSQASVICSGTLHSETNCLSDRKNSLPSAVRFTQKMWEGRRQADVSSDLDFYF